MWFKPRLGLSVDLHVLLVLLPQSKNRSSVDPQTTRISDLLSMDPTGLFFILYQMFLKFVGFSGGLDL